MTFYQQEQQQLRWLGTTPKATYQIKQMVMETPLLRYHGALGGDGDPSWLHIEAQEGQWCQEDGTMILHQAVFTTLEHHQAQTSQLRLCPEQHYLHAEHGILLQTPQGSLQAEALVWLLEADQMYFYGPVLGSWQLNSQP